MNVKQVFKDIAGREPSDGEIQKIISIADNCEIPVDDPLFPWFLAQEIYHQSYSKMPERLAHINRELDSAASSAAKKAADASTARVNAAVEKCIPELAKASREAAADAAERAVSNVEYGRSSISIFLGMISIVFSALFGCLLTIIWESGSQALFNQSISVYFYVGLGSTSLATLILYFISFDGRSYKSTLQNISLTISVICIVTLAAITLLLLV